MPTEKDELDWSGIRVAIMRLLRRRGIPSAAAEDLAQDALQKMLRGDRHRWSNLSQALAYAATTARSVMIDYFRTGSTHAVVQPTGANPDELPSQSDLSAQSIQDSLHISLVMQKLVTALPSADLEILRAASSGRGSLSKLARERGVHRATVQRTWRRILRKLRFMLLEMAENDEMLGRVLTRRGYD